MPIQIEMRMDFWPMSQLAGKVKAKLRTMNDEVKKFTTEDDTPYKFFTCVAIGAVVTIRKPTLLDASRYTTRITHLCETPPPVAVLLIL